jgi:hypothetical protein
MPHEQNVDFCTDDAPVEGFSPATGQCLAKEVPAPGMVVFQYEVKASSAEMSCKSEILVPPCCKYPAKAKFVAPNNLANTMQNERF